MILANDTFSIAGSRRRQADVSGAETQLAWPILCGARAMQAVFGSPATTNDHRFGIELAPWIRLDVRWQPTPTVRRPPRLQRPGRPPARPTRPTFDTPIPAPPA